MQEQFRLFGQDIIKFREVTTGSNLYQKYDKMISINLIFINNHLPKVLIPFLLYFTTIQLLANK
jgi:hypothetical protein